MCFLAISGIKHFFHPFTGNRDVLLIKPLIRVLYHLLNMIIWVWGVVLFVLPLTCIDDLCFVIFKMDILSVKNICLHVYMCAPPGCLVSAEAKRELWIPWNWS